MRRLFLLVIAAVIVSACSPQADISSAENTMRAFFTALVEQDYQTAVSLYGGNYTELTQMNPDISATDYITLWQRGCEQNGFVCMEVLEIVSVTEGVEHIEFNVTFQTKDGGRFEFTGCCGETLSEPVSEYAILVRADGHGGYKVLSLPPYVP